MKNIPNGWEEVFKSAKAEFLNISNLLDEEIKKGFRIVPNFEDIFKVFRLCKPEKIKVCIVAMEPYPQIKPDGKPVATGLAFSTDKTDEAQMSTKNIYKEIINSYPNMEAPRHGDLKHWVNQGVFLLNVCLTCRAGEMNSHARYKLWLPFMDRFVKYLSTVNKNCIFVLWGNDAQKLESFFEKNFKNIIKSSHPSGNSAFRGFLGCNHFKIINDMLIKQGKEPIKWLSCKPSLEDLKRKLISELINEKELKSLETHYFEYYSKTSDISLKEFVVQSMLNSCFDKTKFMDFNRYMDFIISSLEKSTSKSLVEIIS